MFSVPLKHTTTYQHAFDERMNILILKYVNEGMGGVAANNKARFEAKDYAEDVVKQILDAEEATHKTRDTLGRFTTRVATP